MVGSGGLASGLRSLDLGELDGRPAAEVIAAIAEHLGDGVEGTAGELLQASLRDVLFEIADGEDAGGYGNLEASLQSFLAREGVVGLVESFLTSLVVTRVWFHVESHVQQRAGRSGDAEALRTGVEMCVRQQVRDTIADAGTRAEVERMDWFGRTGLALGEQIASDLEARLTALE